MSGLSGSSMEKQYTWIMEQIAAGKVVLAYDRRAVKCKVYRLTSIGRVTIYNGDVYIHGINARGWTFAVKP